MNRLFIFATFLVTSYLPTVAQPTVGLLYHTESAFNGYTLLAPVESKQTFFNK